MFALASHIQNRFFCFSVIPSRKPYFKNVLLVVCISFFCLNSQALPLTPDEIPLPKKIKNKSPVQINAVFSSLEKQHKQKTANVWKLKYHKALLLKEKDEKSFCSIMKELSDIPIFPLKDLALIQSYELCPYPEGLIFDPEQFSIWLRLRLAKSFYKRRKFFEEPEQTLKAIIYLAKNSAYKDLRVSYLKHALSLANEQKEEQTVLNLSELLYKEAPRFKPNPNFEDYPLLAEDLRQNRDFKKAIVFYIKTLNSPSTSFEEKHLSFKGLNQIYKLQKNHKKQIQNSIQWSSWLLKENTKQSLKKYYSQQLKLAQKQWNLDENEKAIQIVTNILQDKKSTTIKEKALYLRGLIYAQEKKTELSLKDWDEAIKLLNKKQNKPALLEKILWKKAWILRAQNNYRKAFNNFNFLEKITKNPYTLRKVLFWKGKTLYDLGQKTLAKRTFKQLIEKDQFGYYGLLAHKILNKKPEFQKKEESSESIPVLTDTKDESLIHWLILFKETELLSQFLDTQKNDFLNQKNKTKKDWLKMISMWIKAKKYLEVFQSMEKMDDKIQAEFLNNHSHLLFPMDFSKEVEKASKKWNIPKAFIFAIIRQESAFNKRARSPADAFGLMQLIPSTARQTAKKFKIPYRNYRDLYKPAINILLGTAHLKELLKIYDNSFLFSVAAYNAGGTPINKWKQNMEGLETLEFIENIPYEETRTYVRLIIRNYIFYHNELNDENSWFPGWLLQ